MDHLDDFHFWPSLSRYESDGSILSFHLTINVGKGHIDGRHQVALSAPDFPFWSWLHEIRHFMPPYFKGKYLHSLRHHFDAGKRELALRKLSIPVYFINTESEEVDRMFPQLRPFLHGWGETFLFNNGKCDLFCSSKDGLKSFSSHFPHIFQNYTEGDEG